MDTLLNLYAKITGIGNVVMDWLPVVGAVGSVLAVCGGILSRAASAQDPAGVLHALRVTPAEYAQVMLAVGVIKAHFDHRANAGAISSIKPPA